MKKNTVLISLLLTILTMTFVACTPSNNVELQKNTEGIQNLEEEHQSPPMLIQLKSEEDFKNLYDALSLDSEPLKEFLNKNHYSMNGIRNKEELQAFWEKTLNVPLPNLTKDADVSDYCLQYYPETSEYILWYTLGGWQYRFSYKEGPLTSTEMPLNPVFRGELHGVQIALRELGDNHAWEYGAEFRIEKHNVSLWVRKALGVTSPEPLSLNFSEKPWVTVDEEKNATFHMGEE